MTKRGTFLWAAWFAGQALATVPEVSLCARIVKGPPYFAPHLGQKIEPMEAFPEAQVFYLGSGISGTVLRIVPPSESPFVLKILRKQRAPSGFSRRDMPDLKAPDPNDISGELSRREKILQFATALQKPGVGDLGFAIPSLEGILVPIIRDGVKSGEQVAFKFAADIRGRTVVSLLEDPTIEAEFKDYILSEYTRRFELFRKHLSQMAGYRELPLDHAHIQTILTSHPEYKYPFVSASVNLNYETGHSRVSTNHLIELKADAVIVGSETLDMSLVDLD